MTILSCHHHLVFVCLIGKCGQFAVYIDELRYLTTDSHVVGLCIKRKVGTKDLWIIGLVHVQPLHTVSGRLIDTLCTLKVVRPIPFLACLFFDKGDTILDLLCCVILYVVLSVAHRGCQLEDRDTVF